MIFAFFTRMTLYLLAVIVPVIHPAIAVSYDSESWWLWFLLVPGEMLIAFFIGPPKFSRKTGIYTALAFLLNVTLFVTGISSVSLKFLLAGSLSFLMTILVFRGREAGKIAAVLEQLFLVYIYYKILSFSRGYEDIARESSGLTRIILFLLIASFLVHGMVHYFAAFRPSRVKKRREGILFVSIALPLFSLFAFVLPSDFVRNSIILNNLYPDKKPDTIYPSEKGKGWDHDNNGLSKTGQNSGGEGDMPGDGRTGRLQGVPSEQWGSYGGTGGSGGKQYAVMIVISPRDPVYGAEEYFSYLDPVSGFVAKGEEDLNSLTSQRLLETWRNPDSNNDSLRAPVPITVFSTLTKRHLAYLPESIEPTVLKPDTFPFQYLYNFSSLMSFSSSWNWKRTDDPLPEEIASRYLEVPLLPEERAVFQSHLDKATKGKNSYYDRIEGIFSYFSTYQYELGFSDDVSVHSMEEFLDKRKSGDCTEFSNTAAILGRMAGVPSRVVTGYLASKGLQTFAHRLGVQELRKAIPALTGYPETEIYLVTTAHHHSWVQYYIPGYGWVDFESTASAIPPPANMDPNSMDVVIPIIRDNRIPDLGFSFPWQFLLKIFAIAAIGIVVFLYLYRYGREYHLSVLARKYSTRGVQALYTLLLMKLASRGYSVKPHSMTAIEYASAYPEIAMFASNYTRLRYRREEDLKSWEELKQNYLVLIRMVREKKKYPVRRIFSLKGLYY